MFENTYFDLLIPFLWGKIIGPEQSTDLCFHPANERNLSCIVSLLLSSCSNLALFLLPTWHVNKRSVDSWLATVMINNTAGDTPESSAIFQDLVSILLAPLPSSSVPSALWPRLPGRSHPGRCRSAGRAPRTCAAPAARAPTCEDGADRIAESRAWTTPRGHRNIYP